MSDTEPDFLSIDVSTDDYAETAAGDVPSVPRGHQTEEAFQAQKAAYTAKIDDGNSYKDLDKILTLATTEEQSSDGTTRAKLGKKDLQLLGYAVAELYYDREYARVIEVCDRVRAGFESDKKTLVSMDRWCWRCRDRLEQVDGQPKIQNGNLAQED